MRIAILFFITIIVISCQQERKIDYNSLKATTDAGIQVVVEIPAGTNHKIEYDKDSGRFIVDQKDGKDRVINFLPYPANYGYIPGTVVGLEEGGDGDALDVLLLSEALPTGTVIEAIPIAALELLDEGQRDTKIIAVPVDTSLQIIRATDYRSFMIEYDGARHIIEKLVSVL
jgi:inorganic pyrophosphatase